MNECSHFKFEISRNTSLEQILKSLLLAGENKIISKSFRWMQILFKVIACYVSWPGEGEYSNFRVEILHGWIQSFLRRLWLLFG